MKRNLQEQFSFAKPGDFGIIGDPIEHSLSPDMHNPALRAWWVKQGHSADTAPTYHRFSVKADELKDAFQLTRKTRLRGINVTVPHKSAVQSYLDRLDPFAKKINSVNTILNEDGKLSGFNTDGDGFVQALKEDLEFDPAGRIALVLGTGGTGSVLIQKLLDENAARVYYWNRTLEKILEIPGPAQKLKRLTNLQEISAEMPNVNLVVNATSVGLGEKEALPLAGLSFDAKQFVYDVVYHRETAFLKHARSAGAKASGGLGMLLYQGAKSFEIWTGAKAPLDIMRKGLK